MTKLHVLLLCLSTLFLHSVTASVEFPDRFMLVKLFRQSNFAELNKILEEYQQGFEAGTTDERILYYALEGLSSSNPDSEYLLNQWVKAFPDSYIPYLARANYYYNTAWSWRGHENINTTAAHRLANMREYLELAADDLRDARELRPALTIAYALAIRILMLMGSAELREELYNEVIAEYPYSYLVRSSYLWSLKPKWGGNARRLLAYLEEMENLTDNNFLLKNLLGYSDYIFAEALSDTQEFKLAKEHYDFAVSRGSDHIVYRERGINSYQLGDYEQALEDFNMALDLWPQNHRALRWRANVYMRQGNFTEAVNDLAAAAELNPYDKYVLLSLASVLRKLGGYIGVVGLYDRALHYNNHDARIWFERGMHYARDLFKFDLAAQDLKRATELDPDNAQYWYQYTAALHYSVDCGITVPLQKYLMLCSERMSCKQKELEWARNAKVWLQENHACK